MTEINVLIVEDEVIIAEDIKQVLLSLNYRVVGIATKYSAALEALDKKQVDLVLVDIMLGGNKNGIDLAHQIRDQYKTPFVFLTSHADAATVRKAKETRPNAYLLKPFSKDDLFTTLEIALADRQAEKQPLPGLSDREMDVFNALSEGHTDQEIADLLFISLNTTKTHLKSIYKKLQVRNRLEAVSLAGRMN